MSGGSESFKYAEPGLQLAHKTSTGLVNETARGLEKLFGENTWLGHTFGTRVKDASQKDKEQPNRWMGNTGKAAATIYGGISALGEGGGSAAAGAGGDGAFLGEGVPSGIEAWDGASGGMGLGVDGGGTFDPNGMPEGSNLASDFPTQGGKGNWMSKLMGGQGGGGQQGGAAQGAQGQRPGPAQSPNMGNPALTAALTKLVDQQEASKRQQEGGPLSTAVGQAQQPYSFGLTPEDLQKLMANYQYQNQYGGDYARTY